jgi:ribonuclease HI
MNTFALFTDVSLNPLFKCGVGGYILVPASFLRVPAQNIEKSEMTKHLVIQRFEGTSSSKLELQTALWALEDWRNTLKSSRPGKLLLYTDSQCIAGLLKRRPGLVAKGFVSKQTNSLLRNTPLYRKFYELSDKLGFEILKVAGHTRSCSRDNIHCIFSFVDREVRKELKLWMAESELKTKEK